MNAVLPLSDVIAGMRRVFAFLQEEFGYVFSRDRETSDCSEHVADVLRWVNARRGRALETFLVPLDDDYTHCFTAFMRSYDGRRTSYEDNINFLRIHRVLAYYDVRHPDIPMTRSALLDNFQFYASVLRDHAEFLDSNDWFDRDRMLRNERALYVLDWDWRRDSWLDELTEGIAGLLDDHTDLVTSNSNDRAPWDLCGHMAEVRTTAGDLIVRVRRGINDSSDPRDPAYAITLSTPDRAIDRELGVVFPLEIVDAISAELLTLRRRR